MSSGTLGGSLEVNLRDSAIIPFPVDFVWEKVRVLDMKSLAPSMVETCDVLHGPPDRGK